MSKINYKVGDTHVLEQTEAQAGTAKPDAIKSEGTGKAAEQEPKQTSSQGDGYISSKDQKPSGLYNVSRDKDGNTVIKYDDPRKSRGGQDITSSVTNLETKRNSIKMKIKIETDAGKVKELKKKLKEIEQKIKDSN